MNRYLKLAVLSAAVFATTLSSLPSAYAGDGWRHRHHRGGNGDLVAAGVLGLAVGAIAAGIATSNQPDDEYYEPIREPRPRPRPVRNYDVEPEIVYADQYGLDPWTPEWYRYCEDTYQSFNHRSGTYLGYDGRRHFCEAN